MSDENKINKIITKLGTITILKERLAASILYQSERITPTNTTGYTEREKRPLWRSLVLNNHEWLRGYGPAQWICDFCGAFTAGKLNTKHSTKTPEGITARIIQPDHGPIRLKIEAMEQSLELTKIEAMHTKALLGKLLSACQWPVMDEGEPIIKPFDEIPF